MLRQNSITVLRNPPSQHWSSSSSCSSSSSISFLSKSQPLIQNASAVGYTFVHSFHDSISIFCNHCPITEIECLMYRRHVASMGLMNKKDAVDIAIDGVLQKTSSRVTNYKLTNMYYNHVVWFMDHGKKIFLIHGTILHYV